jgi:CubicO group peptidase (beta-lactamase class C family)
VERGCRLPQRSSILIEILERDPQTRQGVLHLDLHGRLRPLRHPCDFGKWRQRIFLPIGMTKSVVHDETLPEIPNRAIGYEPDGDGFVLNDYDPLNVIIGSGGIYSTLDDMFLWDQALYGESLVSKASLELAFASGTNNAGESLEYGFGWRIEVFQGHRVVRHGGSWVGFRTHILRIPDLQFSIVLLSNRADTNAEDFVDRVAAIYLAEPD